MIRILRPPRVAAIALAVSLAGPGPGAPAPPAPPAPPAALEPALAALGLARDELSFARELEAPDRFRMPAATRTLVDPLGAERELGHRAAAWLAAIPRPGRILADLAAELGVPLPERAPPGSDLAGVLCRFAGLSPGLHAARLRARTAAYPAPLAGRLAALVAAWLAAEGAVLAGRAPRTPEELELVFRHSLAPDDGKHEEPDPAELARLVGIAGTEDGRHLVAPALALLAAMEDFEATARALPPRVRAALPGLRLEGPGGRLLVLAGASDDTHDLGAGLLVDLGGDDRYEGARRPDGPAADPVPVRVVLDLAGDDRYRAGACRLGGGFRGIGLVLDGGGDDSWEGPAGSLGAGVLGVGLLVDRAGKDVYRVPRFGLGAGLAGVGLLVDGGGSDGYYATGQAQGFAGLGGVGVLAEADGHDVYHLTAGPEDFRGEFFDSFGQGTAVGLRNHGSGGLAALVDGGGNDTYQADYWAQGVGYWYGLGFLVDRAGDDRYLARRYAQGAGVHFAAGVLLDEAGHDRYVSSAVSQGTGYDLGFGGLVDAAGDDTYLANDLAQGGAYANGFGWLQDRAGNDAYLARRSDVQGHGRGMRGFASVGILLDTGGLDRYHPAGRNDAVQPRGDAGVLVDAPGP